MGINVWFTADTHFGHRKALEFRPGFDSLDEHDFYLVALWNSVVRPKDLVWHLGDVAFHPAKLALLNECNGRKKLVLGNHDRYPIQEYAKYFDEIYGVVRNYGGMVLSHVPIHKQCLEFRWKANIHGHIHDPKPYNLDGNYVNVCVDSNHYAPVSLDEVRRRAGITI